MITPIEIDKDFEPIEFDSELPLNLVHITDKGINRAKIELNRFSDLSPNYPISSMPITLMSGDPLIVALKSLPEDKALKSNQRLKLGMIVLLIPEGFLSIHDETCQQHNAIKNSSIFQFRAPNDIHLNSVVDAIIKINCNLIRKSKLTFSLRNKNMKAKDIEDILDYLVNCEALQKFDNEDKQGPVVGRKPSQEYMVLWGNSQFFPQKLQEKTGARINTELSRID